MAHAKVTIKENRNRSGTTVHGWKAVLFSLPFVGFGAWMVLVGMGIAPMSDEGWSVPVSEATVIGYVFGLPGLIIAQHGLSGVLRERRARVYDARGEWWMADYPWHAAYSADGYYGDAMRKLGPVLVCGLIAWGLSDWHEFMGGLGWYIAGVLYVLVLITVLVAARAFAHAMKYGVTRLHYPKLPIGVGERMELVMESAWLGAHQEEQIELELRCIQERYVEHGEKTKIDCEELFTDALIGERDAEGRIVVAIEIPDDPGLGTCLREMPPRYWELRARSQRKGVDYEANLLVPIYAPRA